MRCLLSLMLATACAAPAPPSTPPAPSTPPPVAPLSHVPATSVSGRVISDDGHIVSDALVTIRVANAGCVAMTSEVGGSTDQSGLFNLNVEGKADCVLIEARSGGATGSLTTREMTDVTVRLDAPPTLMTGEARRLVTMLSTAINDPAAADAALALYVAQGPEALRVAIEQYRQLLGTVTAVREVASSYTPSPSYRHHTFALEGSTGRTLHVDVHQEALTRLHSALLDYGLRSERFMNAYIRAVSRGDAMMLARVLNPDDVDFPVEKAREMIAAYRDRFRDPATIRPEFAGVDEARHTITWRLRGTAADGTERSEDVILRFGDGLIGRVDE
jgi:hypothetical protein